MGRIITTDTRKAGGIRVASLTAGEAIQSGDLLLRGADGLVYCGFPPDTLPAILRTLRPAAGGVAVDNIPLASQVQLSAGRNVLGEDYIDAVKLSNGHFVVGFIDSTNQPRFVIYNQDAVQVVSESVVPITCNAGCYVSLAALSAGGFAIAVVDSANIPRVTTYSNAGVVVTAPFSPDSGISDASMIRIAQLSNGNLVIVTRNGSTVLRYAIFTTAGASVKAAAVVLTAQILSTTTHGFGVAAGAGGGFLIAYYESTASFMTGKARIYDSAGTAVGGPHTVWSISGSGGGGYIWTVPLTGGGYAVGGYSASSGFWLATYSAAGTVQGGPVNMGVAQNTSASNLMAIAAMPSGGVGAVMRQVTPPGGTQFVFGGAAYTHTMGALAAPFLIESEEPPTMGSHSCALAYYPDGTSLIMNGARIFTGTQTLKKTTAALNLGWSGINYQKFICIPLASSHLSAAAYAAISQNISNQLLMAAYICTRQAMTLTGVARNAAAANGSVSAQLDGQASLRLPFTANWSVNQNSSSPPGQKMNVVGNSAYMHGIHTPTTTPIN